MSCQQEDVITTVRGLINRGSDTAFGISERVNLPIWIVQEALDKALELKFVAELTGPYSYEKAYIITSPGELAVESDARVKLAEVYSGYTEGSRPLW